MSKNNDENLLRASLQNHFKILALQQESTEAEYALSFLSDRLQNTRLLLAESESRIEMQQKFSEEVLLTTSSTSRSVSPAAAPTTKPSALGDDKEQVLVQQLKNEIEALQSKQNTLRERNRALNRRSKLIENDLDVTHEHLKRLCEVVSDSRKTIEMMINTTSTTSDHHNKNMMSQNVDEKKNNDDDNHDNSKQRSQSRESPDHALVNYANKTISSTMRKFVHEIDSLITHSFVASAAMRIAIDEKERLKEEEKMREETFHHQNTTSTRSRSTRSRSSSSYHQNETDYCKNDEELEQDETKLEMEKSVLFSMLRKSQKEASFYRKKYEDEMMKTREAGRDDGDTEKNFTLTTSSTAQSVYLPASPRPGNDFASQQNNEAKQEFRIRQLESENVNLTEQMETWKSEAEEFRQRAMDAERSAFKYKMEADALKSLLDRIQGCSGDEVVLRMESDEDMKSETV